MNLKNVPIDFSARHIILNFKILVVNKSRESEAHAMRPRLVQVKGLFDYPDNIMKETKKILIN